MIPVFNKQKKHMLALKALRAGQSPAPSAEEACPGCGATTPK